MIIGSNRRKRISRNYSFVILTAMLLLLLNMRYDFTRFAREIDEGTEKFSLFCDLENSEGEVFDCDGQKISGADLRSDEMAYSGDYSIRLDKENRFGLEWRLKDLKASKRYRLSVWTKNPHPCEIYLVASAEDSDVFYRSGNTITERNGEFWDKRELSFQLPEKLDFDVLKIYVYKGDSENYIYVDDLRLEELDAYDSYDNLKFKALKFDLAIDKEGLDYLDEMKKRSIAQGVIFHDDSKISVKINDEGREKMAKLRIKGDWLDHIAGNMSYRIDMNSEESWNGMQSFSVQEAGTRGFIRNWVFFKFLDHVDVIHPRADFMWMQQNLEKPFVFSFEEHFTKNLVEYRNRREGPIVKLTEDRIWDITKRYMAQFNRSLPGMDEKDKTYWRSEIRAFKENKMLNNPGLKNNFDIAQNLMYQFKYDLKPASELFDIDRLAQYLALVDICLAKHAITWHNQRFYYNPVTALLEPIGFDAYTSEDPNNYADGILSEEVYSSADFPHEPLEQLLFDDEFAELYYHYLFKYSDPEFIVGILDELEEGISSREEFLQVRFKGYMYDRQEILDKAKKIRISLDAHVNSLIAFRSDGLKAQDSVRVFNTHGAPLKVYTDLEMESYEIIYPYNLKLNSIYYTIPLDGTVSDLRYEVLGMEKEYTCRISSYDVPENYSPRQELGKGNTEEFVELFEDNPMFHVVKEGSHTIDRPLVISDDKQLIIKAGTELNFGANGFLLSYAPVQIKGDEAEPVIIRSTDGRSGSFSVIQAQGSSSLSHVIFENQNTLNYKKWSLTGAVNFYESDVDMYGVQFKSNHCEDALNIIRSEFSLDRCAFYNSYGDAFDSDFCVGTVLNSLYKNCGNDAIDASGSTLELRSCIVDGAGDKGISGGEMSTITVRDCKIFGANIGIASKDRTRIDIDELELKDCKTGFTAFQKKPEFGAGYIRLNTFTMDGIEREFLIEDGSTIDILTKNER